VLNVKGRRRGRQLGTEHRFADEVEVARVLEHSATDDEAQFLVLQAIAGDKAVDG